MPFDHLPSIMLVIKALRAWIANGQYRPGKQFHIALLFGWLTGKMHQGVAWGASSTHQTGSIEICVSRHLLVPRDHGHPQQWRGLGLDAGLRGVVRRGDEETVVARAAQHPNEAVGRVAAVALHVYAGRGAHQSGLTHQLAMRVHPAVAVGAACSSARRGSAALTLQANTACLKPLGTTFPRDLLITSAPIDRRDPAAVLRLIGKLSLLDHEASNWLRRHRLIRAAVRAMTPVPAH